jgi:hypothetical protein
MADHFDELFAKAQSLGLISEAEIDRLTDAIAQGRESAEELIRQWEPRVEAVARAAELLGGGAAKPQVVENVAERVAPLPATEHALRAPLLYSRVRIDGLVARPDLNGTFGKAVGYIKEKARYKVVLEGREEALSLKAVNLSAASDAQGGRTCNNCGKPVRREGGAAVRCQRCSSAWYCDTACWEQAAAAHQAHCHAPPAKQPSPHTSEEAHEALPVT